MKKDNISGLLLYVTWGVLLVLLWTYWSAIAHRPANPFADFRAVEAGKKIWLYESSTSRNLLLEYEEVTVFALMPQVLMADMDSLIFKVDTVGKTPYALPLNPQLWKHTFTAYLEGSSLVIDSTEQWQNAKRKWSLFVLEEVKALSKNPDWKKLSETQQLSAALVAKLKPLTRPFFFIKDGQFVQDIRMSYSLGTPDYSVMAGFKSEEIIKPSLQEWLFMITACLLILAGIYLTWKQNRQISPSRSISPEPEVSDLEPDVSPATTTVPPTNAPEDALYLYLQNFYSRYGGLYQFMQEIPIQPTEEEKQKIKQALVEMALHAHSLTRAFNHSKSVDKLSTDLNVKMILENIYINELPNDSYRVFDSNPEKTQRAYRILQGILKEMDIGKLDGVLMHNIHLTDNQL